MVCEMNCKVHKSKIAGTFGLPALISFAATINTIQQSKTVVEAMDTRTSLDYQAICLTLNIDQSGAPRYSTYKLTTNTNVYCFSLVIRHGNVLLDGFRPRYLKDCLPHAPEIGKGGAVWCFCGQ